MVFILDIVMSDEIPSAPTDASVPSSTLMDLMKIYVDSKLCYHSDPMKAAQFIRTHDRFAYQIDLWTLIDKRKFKRCEKPYNGEPIPSEKRLGLFDYKFTLPDTELKKSEKKICTLEQTRWKAECSDCNGEGRKVCKSCKGEGRQDCPICVKAGFTDNEGRLPCLICGGKRYTNCSICNATGKVKCERCGTLGILLFWWQIQIEWSTIHSVSSQTNTPMTPRDIRNAPNKKPYLHYDEKWSNIDTFHAQFEAYFAKQENPQYPIKLDELSQEFHKKHFKKSKKDRRIAKVKWDIKIINITEVVYDIKGYTNRHMNNLSKSCLFN
jgi:hypothetical protein